MTRRGKNRIAGAAVAAFIAASGVAAFIAASGPSLTADGPSDCPKVGDRCDDGTVYIGSRQLKDYKSTELGDFYLFAAPEDLTDARGNRLLLTFSEAVEAVAGLRGWHGHDGGRFENDAALYSAMRDGRYDGEWFLPPRDILKENLYQNRNEGALKGTFETTYNVRAWQLAPWYLSSTEHSNSTTVYFVVFMDGGDGGIHKDLNSFSARPVRAEPRP